MRGHGAALGLVWLGLALLGLALGAGACGPAITRSYGSARPSWSAGGDSSGTQGSRFLCEGEGPSEAQALAAAEGVCTDKLCQVCGAEVTSAVQTTETLTGSSLQRKVVERCRQFRKQPFRVERKSVDCSADGCSAWLAVSFSRADAQAECAGYASEHFADSAQCERLIEEFRNVEGRDAVSLHQRAQLLDEALLACSGIDVRPTPLLVTLHEQLTAGMSLFEFTPDQQQLRLEESPEYASRAEMLANRSSFDFYLTTPASLRRQFSETKTLLGRLQLVRDYVHNRALVVDVIEASLAQDLDSVDGVARVLAALQKAPLGAQYETADVHFLSLGWLWNVHADIPLIIQFYRRSYSPGALNAELGKELALLFAKDQQVDDADWNYIFDLQRDHPCPACLQVLLGVANHGNPALRDARFFAALELELKRYPDLQNHRNSVAALMPDDTDFMLHIRPLLPPELRPALGWVFLSRRLDSAEQGDDVAAIERLKQILVASLVPPPEGPDAKDQCSSLYEKLQRLSQLRASLLPLGGTICNCLLGPLSSEATLGAPNKSELYHYALSLWLPCVRPD